MSNPEKMVTDTLDSLKQGYYDAKDTTKVIVKETAETAEKTGNLVVSGHYTTDDKVQYFLNMDDYEAKKSEGVEMSSLDTLVYYKSKSAAGLELTVADKSDLGINAGVVIDDATDAILQNIKNNIQTSTREELLRDLAVLSAFDKEDSIVAKNYLAGLREQEAKRTYETSLIKSIAGGDTGTYEVTKSGELLRDGEKIDITSIKDEQLQGYFKDKWAETQQSQHEGVTAKILPIVEDIGPVADAKDIILASQGKDEYGNEIPTWQKVLAISPFITLGMFKNTESVIEGAEKVIKSSDDVEKVVAKEVDDAYTKWVKDWNAGKYKEEFNATNANNKIAEINKAVVDEDWNKYDELVGNQHWFRNDSKEGWGFEKWTEEGGKTIFQK